MEKVRIAVVVSGRVRGVFFRDHAKREADKLGLTGWVRNNPDETLECVAEGLEDKIKKFIEFLHHGSPSAQVDKVNIDYQHPEGKFDGFEIIR